MIYFMQILKLLNKEQRQLLIGLLGDLSYEIEEMGFSHLEDQMELVNEILDSHFDIFIESKSQLKMLTEYVIKNQNKLGEAVKRALLCMNLSEGA